MFDLFMNYSTIVVGSENLRISNGCQNFHFVVTFMLELIKTRLSSIESYPKKVVVVAVLVIVVVVAKLRPSPSQIGLSGLNLISSNHPPLETTQFHSNWSYY